MQTLIYHRTQLASCHVLLYSYFLSTLVAPVLAYALCSSRGNYTI
jgi:hypothetical protein